MGSAICARQIRIGVEDQVARRRPRVSYAHARLCLSGICDGMLPSLSMFPHLRRPSLLSRSAHYAAQGTSPLTSGTDRGQVQASTVYGILVRYVKDRREEQIPSVSLRARRHPERRPLQVCVSNECRITRALADAIVCPAFGRGWRRGACPLGRSCELGAHSRSGRGRYLMYTELYVRIWSSCTVILRHEDNF